ncbi:MAG: PTS system mannose/fructose/sorbose family transporter subunit IID [Clostridiales bacterium]|nr:PTS system mannose/fructose/sorbose family transporter subunit IID [Clostridiales bacterium]
MSLLFHAILMSFLAWMSKTGAPMWTKWSLALGAPLISGVLNGIILGNISYGLEMGATVMLVYIGVTVIGGTVVSDVMLGGYLGVTMSMIAGVEPAVGITVASTLGLLGTLISPVEKTLNTIWVAQARKYAAKGDTRGIGLMNVVAPLLWGFLIYFLPGFILIYFGSGTLDQILNAAPMWVTKGLAAVGHLLPALGLAMLMNLLYSGKLVAFFIIGFGASVYLGLGVTPIAIFGVALAMLHYFYIGKDDSSPEAPAATAAEEKTGLIRLEKSDLNKSWLLWICFGQQCYNFEIMQGVGFCHAMTPIIRRLYPDDAEKRREALERHLVYYNTENNFGAAIAGITASMEEEIAGGAQISSAAINSIKAALMGPLAGIGDTVTQSLVKTVFLGIACDMALNGSAFGPVFFILTMSVYALILSNRAFYLGYYSGRTSILRMLSGRRMKQVTEAMSGLGLMVLGGLVASSIAVSTPLTIAAGETSVVLQDVLNAVLPGMLPLIAFLLIYRLVNKGVKPVRIILIIFVVGFIGSLLGILA